MRSIKIFIICIFIFQCNCFSQENLKDSTSNINSINKNDLQFKNFFRSDGKKRMSEDILLGLNTYSKFVDDSSIFLQNSTLSLKDFSKEELTSFKESFSLLMELAKRERNKYDLGFITKYLGISQKVVAIILAVISVAH